MPEHPEVYRVRKTGLKSDQQESKHYGIDALDQEVFEGDEIYVFNGEFYLKEYLTTDARKVLEGLGAEERKAGEES